jgi:transketolase
MVRTPGIDMTTGSLGNGLSAGVGMAIGARMDQKDYHVFVLLGDGELNEGIVWEAAQTAAKYKLDNLTAIVDNNGYQSCGSCEDIMPMSDLPAKWRSFGWSVEQINGHNMEQIYLSLSTAKNERMGRPKVVIARTVKGKGVSFMENDNSWHQRALTEKEWEIASKELGGCAR